MMVERQDTFYCVPPRETRGDETGLFRAPGSIQ
jgi:hypothetical protein